MAVKKKKIVVQKKKVKKSPKRFSWEHKPIKEKPRKSDFLPEALKWRIRWLKNLLNPKKIEKPLKRDFEEKKVQGSFKWEERDFISKPRATDFKEKNKKLKWRLPWLEELINPRNKFDEPKAEDFTEEKDKKRLVGEKHITPASSLIGKETHFIVEEQVEEKREVVREKSTEQRDWIASAILILVAAGYVIFLGMLSGRFFFNISSADYASLSGLFFAITIISILLSLFFCLKKNLTIGFFYISIILLIYLGLSIFLAKNLFETINILLILAAIFPIEVYNIFYNAQR